MNDPYSTPHTTIDPAALADYNRGTTRAKRAAHPEHYAPTVPCGCGKSFPTTRSLACHRARSGCKAVAK